MPIPKRAGSSEASNTRFVSPEIAAEAAVWVARLHGSDRSRAMERECLDWLSWRGPTHIVWPSSAALTLGWTSDASRSAPTRPPVGDPSHRSAEPYPSDGRSAWPSSWPSVWVFFNPGATSTPTLRRWVSNGQIKVMIGDPGNMLRASSVRGVWLLSVRALSRVRGRERQQRVGRRLLANGLADVMRRWLRVLRRGMFLPWGSQT